MAQRRRWRRLSLLGLGDLLPTSQVASQGPTLSHEVAAARCHTDGLRGILQQGGAGSCRELWIRTCEGAHQSFLLLLQSNEAVRDGTPRFNRVLVPVLVMPVDIIQVLLLGLLSLILAGAQTGTQTLGGVPLVPGRPPMIQLNTQRSRNPTHVAVQLVKLGLAVVPQLFVLPQRAHDVVLDEAVRGFGFMNPATQWLDELLRFHSPGTVGVDHLEELLQVRLVDVHHPQAALELGVLFGALLQLFQRQLATSILVSTFKNLLQELLVLLNLLLHFLCPVEYIPVAKLCKSVDYDGDNEIQDAENKCQLGAHKDDRGGWEFLDHRHGNETPTISRNHGLEEQKVCAHHRRGCALTLLAIREGTRSFMQIQYQRVHELNHQHRPHAHYEKAKNE
mmetsp:Transcript_12764/g.30362  ORF Transcript_12764/g.30362 Transcript_12764/m.30362 type:complete len:392 (-) Transcript_12764:32-1207(-)